MFVYVHAGSVWFIFLIFVDACRQGYWWRNWWCACQYSIIQSHSTDFKLDGCPSHFQDVTVSIHDWKSLSQWNPEPFGKTAIWRSPTRINVVWRLQERRIRHADPLAEEFLIFIFNICLWSHGPEVFTFSWISFLSLHSPNEVGDHCSASLCNSSAWAPRFTCGTPIKSRSSESRLDHCSICSTVLWDWSR